MMMTKGSPRLTVFQAVERATKAWEAAVRKRAAQVVWTPSVIVEYASVRYGDAIGKRFSWVSDPSWLKVGADILKRSAQAEVDPRVWVVALLYEHIRIAQVKPWRVYPRHLSTDDAEAKVASWRRTCSDMTWLDPEWHELRTAECAFAEFYVPGNRSLRDVEREIEAVHPNWRLSRTAELPHVRLFALHAFLEEELDSEAYNSFPAPREPWRWVDIRDRFRVLQAKEYTTPQRRLRPEEVEMLRGLEDLKG